MCWCLDVGSLTVKHVIYKVLGKRLDMCHVYSIRFGKF